MRKIFVPFLCNKNTFLEVRGGTGVKLLPNAMDILEGFFSKEEAIEAAQKLSLSDPKGKVIILESLMVVEPYKVEFIQKVYNNKGELIV